MHAISIYMYFNIHKEKKEMIEGLSETIEDLRKRIERLGECL